MQLWRVIGLGYLAAAVIILYLPSILKGSWLFDDPALTDAEWKFKKGAFRLTCSFREFLRWPRSVTYWTYQRLYDVFGFDCRAHRAFNLILHLLATGLVYRIAGARLPESAALLAAGIFALHPLQVASVAYVSARPGMLAAVFAFAAIFCLGNGFWVAGLLSQFLAQKSKEDSWLYLTVWPLLPVWFTGMPGII